MDSEKPWITVVVAGRRREEAKQSPDYFSCGPWLNLVAVLVVVP